jgi:hypothetical protein
LTLLNSGPGGRRFKSSLPDHFFQGLGRDFCFFVYIPVDDFVTVRAPGTIWSEYLDIIIGGPKEQNVRKFWMGILPLIWCANSLDSSAQPNFIR